MEQEKKAVWPGWETVRLIGRGSYGAVYEIERDNFGYKEKAALKVISIPQSVSDIDDLMSDGYDEESITARFKGYMQDIVREYSMMADMKGCANIVYCDDWKAIQHEDGPGWDICIKMELLTALPKVLGKEIPEEQVVKIGTDICSALVFCEKRNLLHRDIKPQNIFSAPDGTYKLGDFGIAKTAERTTSGTKTGSYKYMAPEVYNNEPYGEKVDIYSLGLVLYWLLNERRTPFLPLPPKTPTAGEEDRARTRRFKGEKIPEPAHGSKELKRIVLKACAYDPEYRYRSAEEMLRDLQKLSGRVPIKQNDPQSRKEPAVEEIDNETIGAWGVEKSEAASAVGESKEDLTSDATIGAFKPASETKTPSHPEKKRTTKKKGRLTIILAVAAVAVIGLLIIPAVPSKDNTISFGHYEQDNNPGNGKEEIEWIILDKEDGRMLVVSRYALDYMDYSNSKDSYSWESCTLRTWLNSTFMNEAFSKEEKSRILKDESADCSVFLLDSHEVYTYFASNSKRRCKPTGYVKAQGCETANGYCQWWLRFTNPLPRSAVNGAGVAFVGYTGDTNAVRPALWIDLGS